MKQKHIKYGMKVRTLIPMYPYYADKWELPIIPAGTIGVIGAVKVPKVRNSGGSEFFNCVDFPDLPKFAKEATQRAAYEHTEIEPLDIEKE